MIFGVTDGDSNAPITWRLERHANENISFQKLLQLRPREFAGVMPRFSPIWPPMPRCSFALRRMEPDFSECGFFDLLRRQIVAVAAVRAELDALYAGGF